MIKEKAEELSSGASHNSSGSAAERCYAEGLELYRDGTTEALLAAIAKLEEALRRWREAGDRGGVARAHTNLGRVYESLGRKERAIEQYLQALPLWRSSGDNFREARTLHQIGQLYDSSDAYGQALDYYQQALPLWRASGIAQGEAGTLHNLGVAYSYLGQEEQALDCYRRALALWQEMDTPVEQARTLSNMGCVYDKLCDKQRALDHYSRALSVWRVVSDQRGEAVTLYVIGKVYNSMGDHRKALHYYHQSLPLWRSVEDHFWEATTLHSLGVICNHLGAKRKALEYYGQALALWHRMGVHEKEARTLKEIGWAYHALGDSQKALDYLGRALPLYHLSEDLAWEVFTLYLIGSIHEGCGERQKAEECYDKVLALCETRGREIIDESVPVNFHHGEDEPGAHSQGAQTDGLGHYRRMRTRSRVVENRRENAFLRCYAALVHVALGEKQKALDHFRRALPLWRTMGDLNAEASTRYQIALIENSCGAHDAAITEIEKGLEIAEFLRTTVASQDLRAFYLASVHDYYEVYIDALMRLDAERPGQGYDAAALQVSERARGRSLLELLPESLADIRQGVDAQLLERERTAQQLLNSHALLREQSFNEASYIFESTASSKEIESLITEYQEVKAQIRAASPHLAALTQPVPLSLTEIQRDVLDQDTLLLEYSLGETQSYLWVVTKASLSSIRLPCRAEIEKLARRFYELLTARNRRTKEEPFSQAKLKNEAVEAEDAARALSRMLLAPVAALLEKKRLLIVSEGALQYIPFAALPEPLAVDGRSVGRALMLAHEIVYIPSASTLAVLRREQEGRRATAPEGVAVFADPVFDKDDRRVRRGMGHQNGAENQSCREGETSDAHSAATSFGLPPANGEAGTTNHRYFPRLLFSRQEANLIFDAAACTGKESLIALDHEAARSVVMRSDLSKYRVIHFATHALLNSEQPELSGIVLSLVDEQGQAQDGFLRLHEVYNLNLRADVVVLSACQTGLGKEIRGEGLIGLTRGFIYAGAARVVASLWQVDDEATAELMKKFYEAMLKDELSPVAALRKAQVELSQRKRWQAPFYWAGFVIQGEWR
ncbi:MAG TPA: CHAT domain-containing tetratricopeptide repeat protein [Pyrinomonadaceae bacterium]|jgi:CHAT domain-containing protein/TPR repeat protein